MDVWQGFVACNSVALPDPTGTIIMISSVFAGTILLCAGCAYGWRWYKENMIS